MKSTGITKHVDKLGRFKIPKEIRTILNIEPYDTLCLNLISNNTIILNKVEDACIFCHKKDNIFSFKNKYVCRNCFNEIYNSQN